MQEDTILFKLSVEEREQVLQHAFPSEELQRKLRLGVREGKSLAFDLTYEQLEELAECSANAAEDARSRKLRRAFDRLCDRVEEALDGLDNEEATMPADLIAAMPPELMREIRRIAESKAFRSLDDMQVELERIRQEYNRRPQADFLGLSPLQVGKLVFAPLDSDDSAVKCNDGLTMEDVGDTEFFANARIILEAVVREGGVKVTDRGNFNRAFVRQMLEATDFRSEFVRFEIEQGKAINEAQIGMLHWLRVVLTRSGFLRKDKGRYHVPKNRVLLLEDENAGKLYRDLFVTHFNDFNLAYGDYGDEHPEVQDTVGYTVWALGQEAREWKSADELAATVFLPAVRQELRDEWWVDAPGVLLSSRVLFPLKRFGLVETKTAGDDAVGRISMNDARVTPLFDKFLRFNLAD